MAIGSGGSLLVDLDDSGQRYVKLFIPSDYTVPDVLCANLTPREVGVLLDLAAKAYTVLCETSSEHQSNEIIQNAIKKAREEAEEKIGALKAEHERRVTESITKIQKLTGELEAANGFKVTLSSQMDELVRAEVERAKELLDRDKSKLVSQIELRYDQMYKTQKDVFDKQLERLQKVVDELNNQKQQTAKSSVAIGNQGEIEFSQLIASHTSWECKNTSKKAHGADLSVKIRDCQVLFEIKNHGDKVAKDEVDKFYRDMAEHLETPFGVFVSLKSGIVGLAVDAAIDIKWTPNHQMVVLVPRFKEHDPTFVLRVLESLSDVALRSSKERASMTESSASMEYENKMTFLNTYIGMQLADMKKFQTQIKSDNKSLQATITQQFARYSSYVANSLSGLQKMIDIISGKELNVETVPCAGSQDASNGQSAVARGVKRPHVS